MNALNDEIKYIKGVGPQKAELLKSDLNIITINDLISHYPYKYIDKTKLYKVAETKQINTAVKLFGYIKAPKTIGEGRKTRLTAKFYDNTGTIELIWFSGIKYMQKNIKFGEKYYIFGTVTAFKNSLSMVHPELTTPSNEETAYTSEIEGVYSISEKMKRSFLSSKALRKIIASALLKYKNEIYETIPPYIKTELNLITRQDAIKQVHFPSNPADLKKARYRLTFEELFYLQMNVLQKRAKRKIKFNGYKFSKIGENFNHFYNEVLPFELTNAQKRVIKEIRRDFGSGKQTHRLLQGDVGSGKTLVAFMCALIAIDNDFQVAFMAPTEVLANQHFKIVSKFTDNTNIKVALLTGSSKIAERRAIHEQLQNGKLNIIVGTHALLEDVVQFKKLGLVIIDEQHRFGVSQRAKMWGKSQQPPHVIIMTATPIPRTLAMTVYGDLEVSVINELPPGRKSVKTSHAYDSQRLRVFEFLRKQINLGRQIYIVYPLITESEKLDYKDLEDGLESISRAFPPPKYGISVVHGKMSSEEKNKSMALFKRKVTQIMIATTVIEVGVDVPNATVMLIESAERFGLSQLHQLRGRVGRGAEQSYCILMTSFKLSKVARHRISILCQTNDGFKIAEEDLKLRGQGDIEGTQQSGVPVNLKIADLQKDAQILALSRQVADRVLEEDPTLSLEKNNIIKNKLHEINLNKKPWGIIG